MVHRRHILVYLLAAVAPLSPSAQLVADSGESLHQRIDEALAASHAQFSSFAAPASTDAEFCRRVHLDLIGRIPSADETRAFLDDVTPTAQKRAHLIDRLLIHPSHARRMQYVFDEMLMERRPAANVPDAQWREYLRQSFLAGKPWNQLVLEILSADGADPALRPAARFYLDRNFDVDLVTRDVGRVFLGVDLECAQCHDHPAIDGYLQRHYYGINAFLSRSYLFTDRKSKQKQLGEKAEGDVKFTSVFTDESGQTAPRLLDLPEIVDPAGTAKQYEVKPSKKSRGVALYSRRLKLAQAMVSDDNVEFRRNIVNRLWALMMGRGLVEPLDVRHSENPPSHPAVLELMADEFLAHDYDVRWLLRELALTEAYQRSSYVAHEHRELAEQHYAVALLKPLSPEQLAWSMMEATGVTEKTLVARKAALLKSDPKFGAGRAEHPLWQEEALHAAIRARIDQFASKFGEKNGQTTSFGATADQALFLMNGPLLERWLTPSGGNLTERLNKLSDPATLAGELYLSILSRKPTADEATEVADYITTVGGRPSAVGEFAWALLSSTEFRFNH